MDRRERETSNYHQVEGVLHHIGDAVNKTKNPKKKPFYVLEFILEVREVLYGNPFSTFIKFEIKNEERFRILDPFEVRDSVIVTFRVSSRKWKPEDSDEEKIFNSLVASSIKQAPQQLSIDEEKPDKEKDTEQEDYSEHIVPPDLVDNDGEDEPDDLPF